MPFHPAAGQRTEWGVVALIIGAGVLSAFQVGEVSMAQGALQADFGIALAQAGGLISVFALVGALAGIGMGAAVDALGARRMVLAGLVLQGLCSLVGAAAGSFAVLLALRVVEGVGFLAVVVAAPSLVLGATGAAARPRAFAALGTYMPLGVAAAMLCAPVADMIGWRGLSVASGAALLAHALCLARGTRHLAPAAAPAAMTFTDIRRTLSARGPWLLAGLFALFSAAFFSVFGFLPDLLVSRMSFSPGAAGLLAAFAMAANAAGNLASGALMARGVPGKALLGIGFLGIALGAAGALASGMPGGALYGCCVALSFVSGFIPVVLLDAAPRRAPSPGQVATTVGLLMQGNNLGLLAGPAMAGWIAGLWGWPWVAAWVALLVLPALALNRWLYQPAGPA